MPDDALTTRGGCVVLVHIGEPKTGTTFLQGAMWGNRARLREQGVQLPGHQSYDQFRAARDLRNFRYDGTHPRGSWVGEWDVLAAQARQSNGVAVISHEILMGAKPGQVERAMQSLAPAEVHVAVTVRDLASLLPAAWQEAVKNGETGSWDDWVADVIDRKSPTQSPLRRGFWRLHDTVPTLRRWAAHIPNDHLHVVTVPPPGSPRNLLWERWAELLGFDTDGTDVTTARANPSLGWPEVEFLRAVNAGLRTRVPRWMYETYVKPNFAEQMLASRPRTATPALTAAAADWVDGYTERRSQTLTAMGVDVRGDLDDLCRRPDAKSTESRRVSTDELVDVGVDAVIQLLAERFEHPINAPRTAREADGWVDRAMGFAASSKRVERSLRELSVRNKWAGKLRTAVWRLSNRG